MKYYDFVDKIGTLAAYVEKERHLQEEGIDLSAVTNDLINDYVHLIALHYPNTKEEIALFIWELEFGQRWKPGFMSDEYGRDLNLGTTLNLWKVCERRVDQIYFNDDDYVKEAGRIHGIDYYICWNGVNWSAYLDLSDTRFVGGLKDAPLGYGGITYAENHLPFEGEHLTQRWFIGWDYAHNDDLMREWSVEQIKRDVKSVIYTLAEMEY